MLRLFALFLLITPAAYAQPPEAVSAYIAGEFGPAAELAEASGEADSLAFAAQCILAGAISTPHGEPEGADLKRAEDLSRKALALSEGHLEARLQLAIALSLQARPMSNRQAMRTGLGQQARDLAEDILKEDPDNVYAHGLLAVWNVEVLRRGGRLGARLMGASFKAGEAHYKAAAAIAPQDGALHWQWARVLAATNPKKYDADIRAALQRAISSPTKDALEGVMQARAARLLALMQTASHEEIKTNAASLL